MITSCTPLIYLVDDDEDDRELLKNVFVSHFKHCAVRTFDNGSGLLAHLTHQLDGRLPDLIILDLDMPIFSGFELLHYLKQDSVYGSIPIVILSGSQHTEHINRCYDLGTTEYMSKTIDYTQLVSSVFDLQRYWVQQDSASSTIPETTKYQPSSRIEGLSFDKLSLN